MNHPMPFDASDHRPDRPVPPDQRPVAVWLFVICAMLLGMVVLGGATRLTGSGLSIMEWAPLTGAIPPLSHHEWQRLFAEYQRIPQYRLMNEGMTLSGFQDIFWLEWTHRLWGRLIGVVFLVPLLVFLWRGRVTRRLAARLGAFFLLGGLQGAVGWFMVASGFEADSTAVSPYRLVAHLLLALALYAAILWTALNLWQPRPLPLLRAPTARRLAGLAAILVAMTITAGGFVAGTHAGFTYNTFPLMDGRLIPPGYAAQPFPRGLFENIPAVQFDHRALATATLLVCLAAAIAGARIRATRTRALALGGAVLLQYALGVATLLLVVPIPLAAAHQAVAVLVLTAVLVLLHALRPARGRARI